MNYMVKERRMKEHSRRQRFIFIRRSEDVDLGVGEEDLVEIGVQSIEVEEE